MISDKSYKLYKSVVHFHLVSDFGEIMMEAICFNMERKTLYSVE
jgi:hypothetical protein